MGKTIRIIALISFFLAASLFTYYLANNIRSVKVGEDAGITDYVVVDEFEGEDFSSVDDFRENSIRGPQQVNIDDYELRIFGLVDNPVSLDYYTIISDYPSYKKDATLHCVEGWSAHILWEGVEVRQLLAEAGIKPEANTIIFRAVDGYTTSFPLEYITENKIIMAYKMNNQALRADRGFPFQLVAESKWGYKWIKWIDGIELSDNEDYEGFWESRGYSNSGDLDKPKFE